MQSLRANRTAVLVHKLLNKTKDPGLKEELQLFSLQLLHRKVHFTAFGFFPLDFTLLYSITGAVTTYLVILIQFQLSFANPKQNATVSSTLPATMSSDFFTPTLSP
ncbi:putative gustatory receptor 28a isoform X3 [Cryptotermes secundus]|uniref:putative gustatory receptor 28a isoform X3 n=1 Tax=Cryptotermes secundus TaxID=105785 RepID=UPI000CD7BA7A|nr:putative gustatory receptor 28a isoform X3 [Cryptotermes secundus]